MLDKVNKNGIKAIWRDYQLTIGISLSALALVLILFVIFFKELYGSAVSLIDIVSISIGLTGLILALWSIQSTTISLNEIQADYWNTRGLDNEYKKNYYNAHQAYDKAIDIDNQSLKFRINKANAKLDQSRMYGGKSVLIDALNIINEAIEKGPRYPATWRKNTLKETKAKQEYANALKTKCDILIDLAGLSKMDSHLTPLQANAAEPNLAQFHFMNPQQNCDLLKNQVSMETLPSSSDLLACALRISNEAIQEYPPKNSQIPGAYVSKGIALHYMGKHDDAIKACDKAIEFWETIGRDSNAANAWNTKGNAYLAKGKGFEINGNHPDACDAYEDAVEAYERATELKPDTSQTWFNKGNALKAQKKYDEAIHAYTKSIEFGPLRSDAWNQMGNVFVNLARALDVAIVGSSRSNTSDPSEPNYDYYKQALKCYDMAIDINPRDGMFWSNKGNVLTSLGKTYDANAAITRANKLGYVCRLS
jgi:tetratricopeptide (TPR) repeat protein